MRGAHATGVRHARRTGDAPRPRTALGMWRTRCTCCWSRVSPFWGRRSPTRSSSASCSPWPWCSWRSGGPSGRGRCSWRRSRCCSPSTCPPTSAVSRSGRSSSASSRSTAGTPGCAGATPCSASSSARARPANASPSPQPSSSAPPRSPWRWTPCTPRGPRGRTPLSSSAPSSPSPSKGSASSSSGSSGSSSTPSACPCRSSPVSTSAP